MAAKALTVAAFGARGTGKTAWIKQQIAKRKPPRLLVWDFKHDPDLADLGTRFDDLDVMVEATRAARFALRYRVNHELDIQTQFEVFCRLAWMAGPVDVFVDELPEVTKANRAPPAWKKLVNVGRKYEHGGKIKWVAIWAAGQRPAECDKTFIANCDVLHFGRLGDEGEAQRWARALGLRQRDLIDLKDLHWIEKRADSSEIHRGVLVFPNRKKRVGQAS